MPPDRAHSPVFFKYKHYLRLLAKQWMIFLICQYNFLYAYSDLKDSFCEIVNKIDFVAVTLGLGSHNDGNI